MSDPAQPQQTAATQATQPFVGTSVGGKEIESLSQASLEIPALKEVGHELPLSQEVTSAGVKIHPTTVQLPQNVTQMGVKAVGQGTPPPAITVTLPLTDEQIAQGLHQSIMSSWRWLAEWCVRRLKQLHQKIVKSS